MKFMYGEEIYDDDSIGELMEDCGADRDFPDYFNEQHTPWSIVKRWKKDSIDTIVEKDYENFIEKFIQEKYEFYEVEKIED